VNNYNGWTNYETWRVNLEIFDGFDPRDCWPGSTSWCAYDLGDFLKGYAEELVTMSVRDPEAPSIALDYALAFLSEVDWRQIASRMLDNFEEDQEAA
jgi:hypothetical protein